MTAIQHQQATLFQLEQVIERGVKTFVEVGLALMEVRDRKLYEEAGYATFDQYCYGRWGFKYERGRQLIEAAQTAKVIGDSDPTMVGVMNERQARAIAPLAKKDPEAARQVLRDVSSQNQHVTASRLRAAVEEHFADDADDEPVNEQERSNQLFEVVLDTVPGARERMDRSRFRSQFADHWLHVQKLIQMDPERTVAEMRPAEREMLPLSLGDVRRWLDNVEEAHNRNQSIRIVGGGS